MGDASNLQTSFLGGEWSLTAQGRVDDPAYKKGMAICYNGYPLEEGAWTRRPGFALAGPTYNGAATYVFPFNYSESAPYTVEVGQGYTRIWTGTSHVFDSEYAIYGIFPSTPMVITVDPACPYVTGDVINILLTSGPNGSLAKVQNRDFKLTKTATGVYTLADPITGTSVAGTISNWNPSTMSAAAARVWTQTNPYVNATDPGNTTACMAGTNLVLFNGSYAPQFVGIITLDLADPRFSSFNSGVFTFDDGPYYPYTFGQVATPTGTSGTITISLSGGFGPRTSVQASDVGKWFRMLSEPLLWQGGTTYSIGQQVVYPAGTAQGPGNYYTSLVNSNVGNEPDISPADWAITPVNANWGAGTITSVINGAEFTLTFASGSGLLHANPINYFQVGLFGGVDGWPTAGTVHEGRLIPVYQNYFLASQPNAAVNNYQTFSPTDSTGVVSDASAINYIMDNGSESSNTNFWAQSGANGLMMGCAAGEWQIQASSLNDPLTPTSIQAHRVTKYGAANVQPARAGFSIMYVQRAAQRVLELISDTFTGKFAAPNLSLRARHIGRTLFRQIQWMETPNPILWCIDVLGNLSGVTYRRLTSFISEEATFVGWHRHALATIPGGNTSRPIISIASGPTSDGTADCITAVAFAPSGSTYVVEVSGRLFTEGDPLDASYFLDDARSPTAIVDTGAGSVVLSGFWPLVGASVTAFIVGLNCGTYTVDATGSITVPYGSDPDGLFTQAYLLAYPRTGVVGMSTAAAKVISTPPASYSATPATIGEYVVSSTSSTIMSVDWGNGIAFFQDNTGTPFLKSFNLTTRASIASLALNSVSSGDVMNMIGPGMDNFYYVQDGSYSHGAIWKMDSATLTPVNIFGTSTNGSPHPYYGVETFTSAAMCVAGGKTFLIGNRDSGTLTAIDLTDAAYADYSIASPGSHYRMVTGASGNLGQVIGVAPSFGNSASSLSVISVTVNYNAASNITSYPAYSNTTTYPQNAIVTYNSGVWQAVGGPSTAGSAPPNSPWSSYSIPNQTGINATTIGTLAASTIDSGWSAVTVLDYGYDQYDGNIIAFVTGTGNSNGYLIKIGMGSANLLWKYNVSGSFGTASGLSWSLISKGVIGIIDNSGNYYAINTSTGTLNATFTVAGCTITPSSAEQIFNGTEQVIYTRYAYNSGTTGAPSPLSGTASTFTDFAVYTPYTVFAPISVAITQATVPALVGFPYTSQGQRLRPALAPDAGAQNGPPQGKTRRNHMYSMLVNNTVNLAIGTDFVNMYPVTFKSPGGTPYLASQGYSGVKWDSMYDGYSFDGQMTWQSTGPYPCIISSAGNFIHTQDR